MNLEKLSELNQPEINPEKLMEWGVIRKFRSGVKVLGEGNLKKALKIQAHQFSKAAKEKIEAAGGEAVVIS